MRGKGASEGVRMQRKQFIGLSQNQIKLIAAAAMVLDHVGMELFPQWTILRIIGRFAFPVFSYCIWEGSRRTHHPWQYLLRMFGMGLLCVAGCSWLLCVYSNVLWQHPDYLLAFALCLVCVSVWTDLLGAREKDGAAHRRWRHAGLSGRHLADLPLGDH